MVCLKNNFSSPIMPSSPVQDSSFPTCLMDITSKAVFFELLTPFNQNTSLSVLDPIKEISHHVCSHSCDFDSDTLPLRCFEPDILFLVKLVRSLSCHESALKMCLEAHSVWNRRPVGGTLPLLFWDLGPLSKPYPTNRCTAIG